MATRQVEITLIERTGGTQIRQQMDWIAVDEYANAMQEGQVFPPIDLFFDGQVYWLADGFHRVEAAQHVEAQVIDANVHEGGKRDAILFAIETNNRHGVRLTNRDKRNIVEMFLKDEEWRQWPLNKIAQMAGVSWDTVNRIHLELSSRIEKIEKPVERLVTRNGKTYTQNTANIGKKSEPKPEPEVIVWNRDARHLSEYVAEPVHLVVTSPPYNVGIDYDYHVDNLRDYFPLLTEVWRECYKVMVDGGRICVVVPFGVNRNPWVPLAPKVADTLIAAGFELRGKIIWDKNTSGNITAWGSFRLPTNPGLRDTTEVVLVAHKNSADLEIPERCRLRDEKGSYTRWLENSDYFMELAQDHWVVAPESAQRVEHPAPFPIQLVERLIHFYAFPGAHIVDPFAGSGTTGVAARKCGCAATLFDIDAGYCEIAKGRCLNGSAQFSI